MTDKNSVENIRKRLALLPRIRRNFFQYDVGRFSVVIFTYETGDTPPPEPDSIVNHKKVHIIINEKINKIVNTINLLEDMRFKDHKPLQYMVIPTINGGVSIGDGGNMPIGTLCELIKYLHRLSNLTVFI